MANAHHRPQGFTMIELVVVISILAILSGVIVPRVNSHMKASRDAERLAHVKTLRSTIDQFHMDRGSYPVADSSSTSGGWDVSNDGNFIQVLAESGYITEELVDPINDGRYHYRYYVYESGAYGCSGDRPFFVLGIRHFESHEFANRHRGFFRCPGRNWGNEFAFVTGGGAGFSE